MMWLLGTSGAELGSAEETMGTDKNPGRLSSETGGKGQVQIITREYGGGATGVEKRSAYTGLPRPSQ